MSHQVVSAMVNCGIIPEPYMEPRFHVDDDGLWLVTTFGKELKLKKLMVSSDGAINEVDTTLAEVEAAITKLGKDEPSWGADKLNITPAWPSHFLRPISYNHWRLEGSIEFPIDGASTGATAELKLQISHKSMRKSLQSLREVLTSMKLVRHMSGSSISEIKVTTTPGGEETKYLHLSAIVGDTTIGYYLYEDEHEGFTSYIKQFEELLNDNSNPLVKKMKGWITNGILSDDTKTIKYLKEHGELHILNIAEDNSFSRTMHRVEPQALDKAYTTAIELLREFQSTQ